MFKSLLRTLPTLSGNIKLSCKIDNIHDTNDVYEYEAYVRNASLEPLQNNIYTKKLNINLLNGKWEFDVKNYFRFYSDVFYKENYSINKRDYKRLDIISQSDPQDSRNKDYEFGCKRTQFSQHEYQFEFYAPIYVDKAESLPDYFKIDFKLNEHLTKSLIIYVGKKNSSNYLKRYLSNYIDQIDENVICCLPETNQATYFGIDCKNGGLIQVKDDVIGSIYNKQMTINNFDYIICSGFERKSMMMRQVIPLSFTFNIDDILSVKEKKFFKNVPIQISGSYYKGGIECDFYDFSIDYFKYYPTYNKYDENTGKYSINTGEYNGKKVNIMDVSYPSLFERRFIKYKYTNKITPQYCRWKLSGSNDSNPYIINNSYAFSILQYPNTKYGEFPTMFKDIIPQCIILDGDMKLPIGNDKTSYYDVDFDTQTYTYESNTNNSSKYVKLMQNYTSTWFSIFPGMNSLTMNPLLWTDVIGTTAYYKGILYDVKDNLGNDPEIDKFAVFIRPKMDVVKSEKYKDIHFGKYAISNTTKDTFNDYGIPKISNSLDKFTVTSTNGQSMTIYKTIYDINSTSKEKSYVSTNKNFIIEKNGSYVSINDYYERNEYITLNDLLKDFVITENSKAKERIDALSKESYIKLPIANNSNMFEHHYTELGNLVHNFIYCTENKMLSNKTNNYTWLKDKLYVTTAKSSSKQRVISVNNTLSYDENSFEKCTLMLKEKFISKYDAFNTLVNMTNYRDNISYVIEKLSAMPIYTYVPYSDDNGTVNTEYFEKTIVKEYSGKIESDKLNDNSYLYDIIYVDTYNMMSLAIKYITTYTQKMMPEYVKEIGEENPNLTSDEILEKAKEKAESIIQEFIANINNKEKHSKYCKILDKLHLIEYIKNLNKNEIKKNSFYEYQLFDNLYVRIKCIINKISFNQLSNKLEVKDRFIKLSDILEIREEFDIEKFLMSISDSKDSAKTFVIDLDGYKVKDGQIYKYIPYESSMTVDLYFKKDFYRLDDQLYEIYDNLDDEENFLYMYKTYDNIDDYYDPLIQYTYIEDSNKCYNDNDEEIDMSNIYCFDQALEPLFSNVYLNDRDRASLKNLFHNNKIQRISIIQNDKEIDSLWKYSDNDYSCFIEINPVEYISYVLGYLKYTAEQIEEKLSDKALEYLRTYANNNDTIVKDLSLIEISLVLHDNDIDIWYDELVKGICNIDLYVLYDINNVSIVDSRKELEGSSFNNYLKMNIVEENGKKYGFYLIDVSLDNTDNSFNIDKSSQYIFDKISGKAISEQILNNMFMYIYPFMKVNVFSTFVNNIPAIVLPKEFNIAINYMSYVEDNGNSENSYKYKCFFTDDELADDNFDKTIYSANLMNDRKRNIKMLRYFGKIEPIVTKRNLLDNIFGIKYKDFNKELGEDNIYEETLNIYDYSPIRVTKYNEDEDIYYIDNVEQYEHKHFNDNLVYNLDTKIEIDYEKLIKYDDLKELESEENTYKIFKKYMSKYLPDNVEKSQILFLLNKYKISYESNSVKLSNTKKDKLYSLKYVFDLI